MRNVKKGMLFALLPGIFSIQVACGGSGDGDGDLNGTGGSGPSGGAIGDGDGDTGGVHMGGDGSGGGTSECIMTAEATAEGDPLIDDFEDGDNVPLENDGRVGQWAHGHWITPAGQDPVFDGGYLTAECVDDAWCNTDWDMATPWAQWASIDLAITMYDESGLNCYDASQYTGIKFMARGGDANQSLRVQLRTPDANSDTGETYQSPEIALTAEWEEYMVEFAQIKQPSWSTVADPLDPAELVSISWVVRTREDQKDDADMVIGEKLTPYHIELDDVSFY